MDSSLKIFYIIILKFDKDNYCTFKGDSETLKKWPSSWYACNAILKILDVRSQMFITAD